MISLIFAYQEFAAFEAFCSEPPMPGQQVSPAMAALMTKASSKPLCTKAGAAKKQKGAPKEASEVEDSAEEASGDLDEREGDEGVTSPSSGRGSGYGEGGDDGDDDDDAVDVNDDNEEVEGVDEGEDGSEEMKGAATEAPRQPLKKLHCSVREECPASHGPHELHGSSQKSPSLQIPLIVPPPARRRHAPLVAP